MEATDGSSAGGHSRSISRSIPPNRVWTRSPADVGGIRGAIGARHQRALEGLKVLADAGVLRQISSGTYDRHYAADELFELIEEYEVEVADRTRRSAGPAGTSVS